MLFTRVGKILSCRKGQSWRDNALNCWVVREVHKEDDILHGSILFKIISKKSCGLHVDAHGAENNTKILGGVVSGVLSLDKASLTTKLCCNLIVWKPSS